MRKYLTIGELADLMKTSTSSIRYYEKEGLLSPCKVDNNGYRLYDFNEIDRLETIQTLRKMDIPLKKLKSMLDNSSIDGYVEALKSALTSIDAKINQLNNTKQYINKKINYIQNFMEVKSSYTKVNLPERTLYCIHTGKILEYTVKDTYDILKSQNIDLDTYQDSYMIPLNNDNYSFCVIDPSGMKAVENFEKIFLPEGLYLNYEVFVENYDMINIEVDRFYDYMRENAISPIGNLIVIENTRGSDYYLKKISINLQIRIEDCEK